MELVFNKFPVEAPSTHHAMFPESDVHHRRAIFNSVQHKYSQTRLSNSYYPYPLSRKIHTMTESFNFGPWRCAWSEAFYLSPLSLAMVNHKPIVPGHCLVVSRRVAARVADLTSEELADLWKVTCSISKPLERFYKAQALTFALQDGPVAGQTVPHVHIHILPRRAGDFLDNNQVYHEMEKTDLSRKIKMDDEERRKPRSLGEMAEEAHSLRSLFSDSLPIPSAQRF